MAERRLTKMQKKALAALVEAGGAGLSEEEAKKVVRRHVFEAVVSHGKAMFAAGRWYAIEAWKSLSRAERDRRLGLPGRKKAEE